MKILLKNKLFMLSLCLIFCVSCYQETNKYTEILTGGNCKYWEYVDPDYGIPLNSYQFCKDSILNVYTFDKPNFFKRKLVRSTSAGDYPKWSISNDTLYWLVMSATKIVKLNNDTVILDIYNFGARDTTKEELILVKSSRQCECD